MSQYSETSSPARTGACWNCGAPLRAGERVCVGCGASPVAPVRQSWLASPSNGWHETESVYDLPKRYRPSGPIYDDFATGTAVRDATTAPLAPSVYVVHQVGDAALFSAPAYVQGSIAVETPQDTTRHDTRVPTWSRPRRVSERLEIRSPLLRRVVNMLFAIGFGVMGAVIGGGIWYATASVTHFEFGPCAVLLGYLTGKGVTLGSAVRGNVPALLAVVLTAGAWVVCTALILALPVTYTPLDIAFLIVAALASVTPVRLLPAREP